VTGGRAVFGLVPVNKTSRGLTMASDKQWFLHTGKAKSKPGRAEVIVDSYRFTEHAKLRMAQRGLSIIDVRYVLRYGALYYAGSAVTYFLAKVDIPKLDRRQYERLEGVAVVTSYEGWIITVWRNRKHGARHIRAKIDGWRCGLPYIGDRDLRSTDN
jgi:hypothetical protein